MDWYVAPAPPPLEISGAALVDLVRRMRHAFLNDLQVFAGWLQLGRPTSAVEYVGRVQSRLSQDSRLCLAGDADLEAALLLVGVEAEKRGVPLSFSVAGVPSPTYISSEGQAGARDRASPRVSWRSSGRWSNGRASPRRVWRFRSEPVPPGQLGGAPRPARSSFGSRRPGLPERRWPPGSGWRPRPWPLAASSRRGARPGTSDWSGDWGRRCGPRSIVSPSPGLSRTRPS